MTEALKASSSSSSSSTVTMVISRKEAGSKRTLLGDLGRTARSPAGWVLLLALLLTWACVAVVLFDLLDYKTLTEYTSYCDDPCFPPGLAPPPPAVRKVLREAGRSRGGLHQVVSDPLKVNGPEEPAEATDWLDLLLTFASSLVAPEEEEVEVILAEEL